MMRIRPVVHRLARLLALALLALPIPAAAADELPDDLSREHREWLEVADWLLTKEERREFLELAEEYQRQAFIRRFWESRDPTPQSPHNEFRERYLERREEAEERFGFLADDRSRVYVFHGEPGSVLETDCGVLTWPLEFWRYPYGEGLPRGFTLLFYQRFGGGRFRLWSPAEGLAVLFSSRPRGDYRALLAERCAELEDVVEEMLFMLQDIELQGDALVARAFEPPAPADPEWLGTFRAFSTDAPEEAPPLPAELEVVFPGRHQSRTTVAGRLVVPAAEAGKGEVEGRGSYNFQLTGEVLREGDLFDSFRYLYDIPAETAPDRLAVVFERHLRPGIYELVLRLDDLNGGGVYRGRQEIDVPRVDAEEIAAAEEIEAEGGEEAPGEVRIDLQATATDLLSGYARFTAVPRGPGVAKVAFLLDGRTVLTKNRPPYSVELDLGSLPRTHTVRAVAYGEAGDELATDQVLLNPGEQSFVVELVEPRPGATARGEVRVQAEIAAPPGAKVDRLELHLDEERVAVLYQEPWSQRIPLSHSGLAWLRAVAYLDDGHSTEDLVVFNAPDFSEGVDVTLVEVQAAVVDPAGRPVSGLPRESFSVLEDGARQELVRFEQLDDLPVHVALLLDTSASMAEGLETVRRAAQGFFREALDPRDRAAVITFSEEPRLAVGFTSDLDRLAGALAGLRAERSTALYDSMVFALYYFQGLKGQRALLVLSDGEDRRSERTFDDALDYARAAGVTIYAIGLDEMRRRSRKELETLATETGGRAFFLESLAELSAIYAQIESDLRSRYLLVYQAPPDAKEGLRLIDVEVDRPGLEVRAPRGYLP